MGKPPYKKAERTIYMDTLDYVSKMKEVIGELEKKLVEIQAHLDSERFENKVFEQLGGKRFEDYVAGLNLLVEKDGSVVGSKGIKIWDLLGEIGDGSGGQKK